MKNTMTIFCEEITAGSYRVEFTYCEGGEISQFDSYVDGTQEVINMMDSAIAEAKADGFKTWDLPGSRFKRER